MTDEELVKRPLDEEFDTTMEVQRDPYGAWQAIQTLTEQLEAARADAKEAEAYAEELEKQLNICRMAQVVMENGIAQVEGEFARAMKHVMDYSNDRHLVAFARAALAEIEGERND